MDKTVPEIPRGDKLLTLKEATAYYDAAGISVTVKALSCRCDRGQLPFTTAIDSKRRVRKSFIEGEIAAAFRDAS